MTTCTSSSITWSYGGGQANLVLAITKTGVSQRFVALNDVQRRQNTAGITVFQTLANVSAQADSWKWPSVNLAQGQYQIRGEVGTVTALSTPFYILNGSDISCLSGVPTPTPSPSVSVSPVSDTSLSHSKKTGVIVGVVVGVIAGICLVVAIIIWLRRRKRIKRIPARGGFSMRNMGQWGSLPSNASSMRPKNTDFANRHYHGHTESTAGMLESVTGSKASKTNPPGDDERVTEVGESEKTHSTYSHSIPGINPLDSPGYSVSPNRHSPMYSIQSPASATDPSRFRTASAPSSNALEQQAHRIRSSMESSACLRTERLSMPVIAPAALDRSPSTPIRRAADYPELGAEASSVQRSASTSGSTPHRTARKPVPHYNPSEFPVQDGDRTRTSSTVAVGSSMCNSAESMPSSGTPDVSRMPSLGHGRPVHYLIPDMPPPSK